MSAIEKALLDATGAKPQKTGEDRQKFLIRVMTAVGKLPDEKWAALDVTAGAQDWYNAATDDDNAEKPVKDFPDAEAAEEPEGDAPEEDDDDDSAGEGNEPEEQEDDVTSKKKPAAKAAGVKNGKAGAKAAPAKKPDKKEAAAPKKPTKAAEAKKPAGKKPTSMRRTLKMIVIKKPKMPVDELIEVLEKKGFKSPSKLTVTSIRADTRDTMKVLAEAGLIEVEV